jgi:hypothetical protein
MSRDPEPDWDLPPPEPLTRGQWILYAVVFAILFLEVKYMWTWCKWFTGC